MIKEAREETKAAKEVHSDEAEAEEETDAAEEKKEEE